MSSYFTDASFRFLHRLQRNNTRDWFHAHKSDYEHHVREPFQHLLTDLQPALHAISPHLRSDPRAVGGSLYRIHRDTRFSGDKTPYKAWQGAFLYHQRRREVPAAPGFYVHLQPSGCFVAAGVWHPPADTLRHIRQFIVDNPAAWESATHSRTVQRNYRFGDDEQLKRPPRGFPADFPRLEDLKQRNFVLYRSLDDALYTSTRLRGTLERDLQRMAPFVDYLCAALELEF